MFAHLTFSQINFNLYYQTFSYTSFRDMCIYAPEIACLHTWKKVEKPDETYAIENYQPYSIPKDSQNLIQEKMTGQEHKEREKQMRLDEIQRFINKTMQQEEKPTFKELDVGFLKFTVIRFYCNQ